MSKKKLKYGLDAKIHKKSQGLIVDIAVYYKEDEDALFVDFARRNDVTDEELMFNICNQVEHALRNQSQPYGMLVSVLEATAGVKSSSICGCKEKCEPQSPTRH